MELERDVENYLKRLVEGKQGRYLKFTAPGNTGVPDRIVMTPKGLLIFVELKRGKGELSAKQKFWIRELKAFRQNVTTVFTKDQAKDFVERWF